MVWIDSNDEKSLYIYDYFCLGSRRVNQMTDEYVRLAKHVVVFNKLSDEPVKIDLRGFDKIEHIQIMEDVKYELVNLSKKKIKITSIHNPINDAIIDSRPQFVYHNSRLMLSVKIILI